MCTFQVNRVFQAALVAFAGLICLRCESKETSAPTVGAPQSEVGESDMASDYTYKSATFEPATHIVDLLDAVVNASSQAEYDAALADLQQVAANSDGTRLLAVQLVFYLVNLERSGRDTPQSLVLLQVFNDLALDQADVITALSPYARDADPRVRKYSSMFMGGDYIEVEEEGEEQLAEDE